MSPNPGLTERAHLYNDKVLVWSVGVSKVACRIFALPASQPSEARNETTHHSCRGWPYLHWSRTLSVPQAEGSQDLLAENDRDCQLHINWSASVPFSPTPSDPARHCYLRRIHHGFLDHGIQSCRAVGALSAVQGPKPPRRLWIWRQPRGPLCSDRWRHLYQGG